MIDFFDLVGPQKELFTLLVRSLDGVKYWNLIRMPTYEALPHYRRDLAWEDIHYRYFDKISLLLFKEGGPFARRSSWADNEQLRFLTGLLTTGAFLRADGRKWFGNELMARLFDARWLNEDMGDQLRLPFRIVPLPDGQVVADVFDQKSNLGVHIGLDSIMLWNYLARLDTRRPTHRFLDLGCGTGLHAILLSRAFPRASLTCVDINTRSLKCTEVNLLMNGISGARLVNGSWFDSLSSSKFDLVVCNPPFEWRMAGESEYRTVAANGGGAHGLEGTFQVLTAIPEHLEPNGTAHVLTQTLVTEKGEHLVCQKLKEWTTRCKPEVAVTCHVLFEHLLASAIQVTQMKKERLSHFSLVVIELKKTDCRVDEIRLHDDRPLLKRCSDRARIRQCRKYWDGHGLANSRKLAFSVRKP